MHSTEYSTHFMCITGSTKQLASSHKDSSFDDGREAPKRVRGAQHRGPIQYLTNGHGKQGSLYCAKSEMEPSSQSLILWHLTKLSWSS